MSNLPVIEKSKPALQIKSATRFLERLVGLLAHRGLPDNSGLYIPRCSAVHTIGMRFPIDVIYLDADCRVLKISTVKPWKFNFCFKAVDVLELNAGAARNNNITTGEII